VPGQLSPTSWRTLHHFSPRHFAIGSRMPTFNGFAEMARGEVVERGDKPQWTVGPLLRSCARRTEYDPLIDPSLARFWGQVRPYLQTNVLLEGKKQLDTCALGPTRPPHCCEYDVITCWHKFQLCHKLSVSTRTESLWPETGRHGWDRVSQRATGTG